MGDSHYFNNELPNDLKGLTIAKIKELAIISARFYDNVGKSLSPENPLSVWDKVAFTNAIQEAFTSANQKPTAAQMDIAETAFREYLKLTKPDKVLFFSAAYGSIFLINPVGESISEKSMSDGISGNCIMMEDLAKHWDYITLHYQGLTPTSSHV